MATMIVRSRPLTCAGARLLVLQRWDHWTLVQWMFIAPGSMLHGAVEGAVTLGWRCRESVIHDGFESDTAMDRPEISRVRSAALRTESRGGTSKASGSRYRASRRPLWVDLISFQTH